MYVCVLHFTFGGQQPRIVRWSLRGFSKGLRRKAYTRLAKHQNPCLRAAVISDGAPTGGMYTVVFSGELGSNNYIQTRRTARTPLAGGCTIHQIQTVLY